MNLPDWHLAPHEAAPEVWTLAVPNLDYDAIGPATPFKFRVDEGRWLDPPDAAPNSQGGNLVFLFGMEPTRLRADPQSEPRKSVRIRARAHRGLRESSA